MVFGLVDADSDNSFFVNLDEHPNGTSTDDRIRVYGVGHDGTSGGVTVGGVPDDCNVTDGTWNYLALTFTGAGPGQGINAYIANAGDLQTTTLTTTLTGTGMSASQNFDESVVIGALNHIANGVVQQFYSGQLDELAIYGRVLSKAELDAHLSAGVIAKYTGGTEPSPTLDATFVTPSASATAISGDNVTTRDDVNANLPASDPIFDLAGLDQTTASGAIADDDFFEFSITPDAGYWMHLDSLVHDHAKGGPSGDRYFFIQTNTGPGGAFETIFGPETSSYFQPSFYRKTIDLSDAKFQGVTGTLTFRYYGFNGSDARTWGFDNITVYGSVTPIPEPATWLLFCLGGLALLPLVRRRRK